MDEMLGGHGRIIEDLLDRLRALQAGDVQRARVVLLQGASGSGKTRIVRELYDRLRDVAEEPRYWPELAGVERVTASGADPMPARKEIAPSLAGFVWPAETLPTFGWWGFNCERLSTNAGQDVVDAARPQLDAHLLPLVLAWREVAGLGDKVKAHRDQIVAEIRDAVLDEGSSTLLDYLESLNIAIPFAGTLLSWGWKGTKALSKRSHDLKAFHTYVDLGQARDTKQRSVGADLAKVIRSVAHRDLPAVVVIEDMHLMGGELAALIDGVSAASAAVPVLVIGTVWPEGFNNPDYALWLSKATRRNAVEVVEVPRLDERDLVEMLRWYAPATSDDTAARVVRQLNNPHFLKLWLTMNKTQRHIKRHDGSLTPDAGGDLELPDDVEEVLADRWKELPQETRTSLLCAVAANPTDDLLAQFVPEVVADIADAVESVDHDSVLRGLAAAVDPAAWCRLGDDVELFTEHLLAGLVRRRVEEEYEDDDLGDIQEATRISLARWIDSQRDGIDLPVDSRTVTVARWFLALTVAGDASHESTPAQAAAQWALASAAAQSYDYTAGIRLGRLASQAWASCLGPDYPDTLNTRNNLASWLGESGRVKEAITEFRGLLTDRQRVLGADHRDTLNTRNNLAGVCGSHRTVTKIRENLPEGERVNCPDTRSTRRNTAMRR